MSRLARSTATAAVLALLPCSGAAQGRHVLVVDQAQSAFSFSGTVTLLGVTGPLQGNPSTFNVSGKQAADLSVAGGALTQGELVAGNGSSVAVPTLNATVPNPLPFLPPLATVTVSGVTLVFTSAAPFAISGGSFNASVLATVLSGTAVVTAAGSTQTVPLAGQQSTAQPVSGTLVPTVAGIRLDVTLATTFTFTDPASGASGTLNLNGRVVADDERFAGDVPDVSLGSGGTQRLRLSAGTANGGNTYFVLGSTSGTAPGINLGTVTLPLNPDGYLAQTAAAPNTPPLGSSLGTLDPIGIADTTFTLPPLNIPALVGLPIQHAYVVVSGSSFVTASNAVTVTLAP